MKQIINGLAQGQSPVPAEATQTFVAPQYYATNQYESNWFSGGGGAGCSNLNKPLIRTDLMQAFTPAEVNAAMEASGKPMTPMEKAAVLKNDVSADGEEGQEGPEEGEEGELMFDLAEALNAGDLDAVMTIDLLLAMLEAEAALGEEGALDELDEESDAAAEYLALMMMGFMAIVIADFVNDGSGGGGGGAFTLLLGGDGYEFGDLQSAYDAQGLSSGIQIISSMEITDDGTSLYRSATLRVTDTLKLVNNVEGIDTDIDGLGYNLANFTITDDTLYTTGEAEILSNNSLSGSEWQDIFRTVTYSNSASVGAGFHRTFEFSLTNELDETQSSTLNFVTNAGTLDIDNYNGTFSEQYDIAKDSTNTVKQVLALGDLNGDGLTDFGYANDNGIDSYFYIQDGSTSAADVTNFNLESSDATKITTSSEVFSLYFAAGDTNGDGLGDIFAYGNPMGSAYLTNGFTGTAPSDLVSGTTFGYGTPFASEFSADGGYDVNGDGFDDLLFLYDDAITISGKVALGSSTGFAMNVDVSGGSTFINDTWSPGTTTVGFVGDANNDGYDDFAAYDTDSDSVVFFEGNASNSYTQNTGIGVYAGTGAVSQIQALGDLNADGNADWAFLQGTTLWLGFGDIYVNDNIMDLASISNVKRFSSAGDFNGDSYSDFLVTLTTGQNYIVFGGDTTAPSGLDLTFSSMTGDGELTSMRLDNVGKMVLGLLLLKPVRQVMSMVMALTTFF